MAANKRTKAQRIRDRVSIARRYLQGEPQWRIAADLGVSHQQVSYDLKALYGEWRKDAAMAINELKIRELAKINNLEEYYWAGFERSRRPLEKTRSERVERLDPGKPETRAGVTRYERDGDPAWLAGVQWCIERRLEILGLSKLAPEQQQPQINVLVMNERSKALVEAVTRGERVIEGEGQVVENGDD